MSQLLLKVAQPRTTFQVVVETAWHWLLEHCMAGNGSVVAVQSMHGSPLVPHWLVELLWQVPDEPQHLPATPLQLPQLFPVTHMLSEQIWAVLVQSVHLLPDVPQAVLAAPTMHLPALEQQLGPLQFDGPQAGVLGWHVCEVVSQTFDPEQAAHALPPEPQAGFEVPAMQLLFWQQPVQAVELHLHWPLVHCCPAAQVVQAAPPVPHWGATGLCTQPVFGSQQPLQLLGPQVGGGG